MDGLSKNGAHKKTHASTGVPRQMSNVEHLLTPTGPDQYNTHRMSDAAKYKVRASAQLEGRIIT